MVGPRRVWRERIERCGTVHTPEGWERRQLRDKARQRAKGQVVRLHRAEFDAVFKADTDTRYGRRWARAARAVADRHPEDYRRFYEAALSDLGYESHPCSSSSTATTMAGELSGPGAVGAARDLPEPGEGSEMAESNRDMEHAH